MTRADPTRKGARSVLPFEANGMVSRNIVWWWQLYLVVLLVGCCCLYRHREALELPHESHLALKLLLHRATKLQQQQQPRNKQAGHTAQGRVTCWEEGEPAHGCAFKVSR